MDNYLKTMKYLSIIIGRIFETILKLRPLKKYFYEYKI